MNSQETYKQFGIFVPQGSRIGDERGQLIFDAISNYRAALGQVRKIDRELTEAAKTQRAAKVFRDAKAKLKNDVAAVFQSARCALVDAQRTVAQAANPPASDSTSDALLRHLRVVELRRMIEALPESNRSQAVLDAADNGTPELLEALNGSLVPLVAPQLVDLAKNRYLAATAEPALERLEGASAVVEESESLLGQLDRAAALVAREEGLSNDVIDALIVPPQLGMSDAQKAAFVGEHGFNAFQKLVNEGPTTEAQNAL